MPTPRYDYRYRKPQRRHFRLRWLILFVLLLTGALKLAWIEDVTGFLTKNMAFFFIPAAVEIMENYKPVADKIVPLLAVLLLTTVITFAVTAGTVSLCMAVQRRWGGKKA